MITILLMALTLQFGAPHAEAVARLRGKPAVSRAVFDALLPALKARAFTITGLEGANVMQRVHDELAGIAAGETWENARGGIAAALEPFLGDGAEKRAELLLRTHGFQAFQSATWNTAQADEDTTHLQYLTMEDDQVRDSHAALDGVILPKDDPFWDTHTPPWDWGCRCRIRPMSPDLVEEARAEDAGKNPEARRVLEGPALRQLNHGTRITPGGKTVNVKSPADRPGGQNAFTWNPRDLALPLDQLEQRYDPEVWDTFKRWAEKMDIAPGFSVLDWLKNPEKLSTSTPKTDRLIQAYETERAARDLSRRQFAGSEGAFRSIRLDWGAGGAEGLGRVEEEISRQHAVELAAVAAGRKPLFHEDYGLAHPADLQRAAAALQQSVPAGIVVRAESGHLYAYNPKLLQPLADPGRPLGEQVVAHRDDGVWLGYGVNHHAPGADVVRVIIQDAKGRAVSGFSAPRSRAEHFAQERVRDWNYATGGFYRAVIERGGRS